MKAAFVLAAAGLAAAQMPDLSNVPQCAITCLLPALQETGCSISDIECACGQKEKLQAAAEPCLQKSCEADDLKKALNAANELCGGGITASGSGAESTASETGASSTEASTGSAVTESSASEPATTQTTLSSGVGPVITSTPAANGTTGGASSTGAHSSTKPTGTSDPGTNGAAVPAAGAFAAIAAAVFAL